MKDLPPAEPRPTPEARGLNPEARRVEELCGLADRILQEYGLPADEFDDRVAVPDYHLGAGYSLDAVANPQRKPTPEEVEEAKKSGSEKSRPEPKYVQLARIVGPGGSSYYRLDSYGFDADRDALKEGGRHEGDSHVTSWAEGSDTVKSLRYAKAQGGYSKATPLELAEMSQLRASLERSFPEKPPEPEKQDTGRFSRIRRALGHTANK
jgi:hypothetical protein